MIKINDNFTYETDAYNWTLYQWQDGTNKDGEAVRTSKKTYYPTIGKMLIAVMDKSLKDCLDFKSVTKASKLLSEDLKGFMIWKTTKT